MAWSSAVIQKMRFGRNRVHVGTFTSTAGSTGGGIDTKMKLVDFLIPWEKKVSAPAVLIGVNADFSGGPIAGDGAVVDELFTSVHDAPVQLDFKTMISGTVVVTDGATYTEGTDYTIDYPNGTITVLSTGTMGNTLVFKIDYRYTGIPIVTAADVVGYWLAVGR